MVDLIVKYLRKVSMCINEVGDMTELLFQYPFWKSIAPKEWAQRWASVYAADSEDERVYQPDFPLPKLD